MTKKDPILRARRQLAGCVVLCFATSQAVLAVEPAENQVRQGHWTTGAPALDDAAGRLFLDLDFKSLATVSPSPGDKVDVDMVDGSVGVQLAPRDDMALRPFVGMRYTRVEDRPSHIGSDSEEALDFEGAGPRIGFESRWQLGSGFNVFADSSGSLIFGNYGLNGDAEGPSSELGMVPMIDARVGASWRHSFKDRRRMSVKGGYAIQSWTDTKELRASSLPKSGLSFDGLFFHAEMNF